TNVMVRYFGQSTMALLGLCLGKMVSLQGKIYNLLKNRNDNLTVKTLRIFTLFHISFSLPGFFYVTYPVFEYNK
ncbi:hypothetical protein LI020_23520, partial [[Clostridium] symbiosum]|uniref:hypothetical protein n=1 Tax=Clostridium symbiosum TaxID=1512 RepID=UPI001D07AA5C